MKSWFIRGAFALAIAPALVAAQSGADNARPITLDDAVRLAVQNSPLTVAARNSERSGEAAVTFAKAAFLPSAVPELFGQQPGRHAVHSGRAGAAVRAALDLQPRHLLEHDDLRRRRALVQLQGRRREPRRRSRLGRIAALQRGAPGEDAVLRHSRRARAAGRVTPSARGSAAGAAGRVREDARGRGDARGFAHGRTRSRHRATRHHQRAERAAQRERGAHTARRVTGHGHGSGRGHVRYRPRGRRRGFAHEDGARGPGGEGGHGVVRGEPGLAQGRHHPLHAVDLGFRRLQPEPESDAGIRRRRRTDLDQHQPSVQRVIPDLQQLLARTDPRPGPDKRGQRAGEPARREVPRAAEPHDVPRELPDGAADHRAAAAADPVRHGEPPCPDAALQPRHGAAGRRHHGAGSRSTRRAST